MAEKTNKSLFTKKQSEKEEKPSEDELKLRKLDEFVAKLKGAVEHKENYEKNAHKEQIKINTNNKSNYSSPTTSRLKEDRSDQEFLSNFMNIDDHANILPKNMHLLTDNDTNQSISPQEKFKNLSNLMLDDKNITEFNFIRNPEERVKLNLYTAFSKKSKELFMNENNVKQSKNQILFHKINDIHIPKFEFKQSITQNVEKIVQNNSYNEVSGNSYENINLKGEEKKDNNEKEQNDENKFNECYFRQEKKGYFHIPSLIKIETKPPLKKEFRKQKTYLGPTKIINVFQKENKKQDDIFWDPEIDADTLSYINHNFICIEDIYNGKDFEEKKEKEKNKNENIQNEENEPNLVPIKAKEIFFKNDNNNNVENNFVYERNEKEGGEYDKLKSENNNINKFIEFIAINPRVIKTEYQMTPHAKEDLKFELNLKQDFRNKMDKISEINLNLFPRNGKMDARRIERYIRFQNLVEIKREIEVSLGKNLSTDESIPTIKEMNENSQIKINNKERLNLKDKSFSEIKEKKSFIYEEDEFIGTDKNNSLYSIRSKSTPRKSGKKNNILNFEGNSFSSEKDNSVSNKDE